MNTRLPFVMLMTTLFLTGCVTHQELVNFNEANLPDETPVNIDNAVELRIQADDLLRITVHSLDAEAAAPFNVDPLEIPPVGGDPATLDIYSGYLVDSRGYIDFPLLGRIQVAGKTLDRVKGEIKAQLLKYLRDPVVNARFINFKVTVLGEVGSPGTLRMTSNRVTILDAIGRAGDLTSYADRNSILVIREEGGQRVFERINLHEESVFLSRFYYLKQNDVIYVEPIQARAATVADQGGRVLSIGTGLVSLVALVLTIVNN